MKQTETDRETVDFASRQSRTRIPRRMRMGDVALMADMAFYWLVVRLFPVRWWYQIHRLWMAPRRAGTGIPHYRRFRRHFAAFHGKRQSVSAKRLWLHAKVVEREERLITAAINAGAGWNPTIHVEGTDQVHEALGSGGVILWGGYFARQTNIGKMALHRAGLRAIQISSTSHGPSGSIIGRRYLNNSYLAAENRYLEDRLLFERDGNVGIVRDITRLLADGKLVLLSNNTHSGSRFVGLKFGDGSSVHFAQTPLKIALTKNIPLFPMICQEIVPFQEYRLVISPRLDFDPPETAFETNADPTDRAIAWAALQVRDQLIPWVSAMPEQYYGWSSRRNYTPERSLEVDWPIR